MDCETVVAREKILEVEDKVMASHPVAVQLLEVDL